MGAEHEFDRSSVEDDASPGVAAKNLDAIHKGGKSCPRAVVDALVEVAWAFPGLRVSCARLSAPGQLTFMTSAGSSGAEGLCGEVLNLGACPRVTRLLSQGRTVAIEDATVDSRMPQMPTLFVRREIAAALIIPIVGGVDDQLIGAITFDAPRPRTWSSKEEVALDNVTPLLHLALENRTLRESLEDAHQRSAAYERQTGAIRGFVDAAVHDSRVLLDALLGATRAEAGAEVFRDTATALEKQLFDVLADLVALPDRISARRDRENIDLNELLVAAGPVLRAVLGPRFRLLVRTDPMPVWVWANRTGLDRLMRTLLTHVTSIGDGHDVVLRAYANADGATIEIGGDAVGTDDRLLSIVSGQPRRSAHELGIDLWQARSEALLGGGTIRYRVDSDGTKLLIDLPTRASAAAGA